MKLENKADWITFFQQYVRKGTATGIVTTLFASIESNLLSGHNIGVSNIFTVDVRKRKQRMMISKHTGVSFSVPEKKTLIVVTRKPLKNKLNKEEE